MSETPFRMTALLIMSIGVTISVYFRRQAEQAGEPMSRRHDGDVISTLLAIFGGSAWLSTMIYLLNPAWMRWGQWPLPAPIRWLGALIGALALPLFYWLFSHLGRNVSATAQTRATATLVTSGPYRWVRHPLYSVGTLSFVGLSLLTANWFIAVVAALSMAVLIKRTDQEEANLIARFGEDYRRYMAETGRFLPKW